MLVLFKHTVLILCTADTLDRRDDVDLLSCTLVLDLLLVPCGFDFELMHDGVSHAHTLFGQDCFAISGRL